MTIAIGVLMLPLGVFMALGKDFVLRLPKLNLGTGSRDLSSVFLFGVSYAVVSLSCTIGLFLSSVTTSFTTDGWLEGFGNFLAYALGMGALITFLTMSLALAKTDVAKGMRQVLPYVGRFSGLVLLVAGLYLIDYGYFEIRLLSGSNYSSPRVDSFLEMQAAVNNWIQDTTPGAHRGDQCSGCGRRADHRLARSRNRQNQAIQCQRWFYLQLPDH